MHTDLFLHGYIIIFLHFFKNIVGYQRLAAGVGGGGGEPGKKLEEMTALPRPTWVATPTFPIRHTPFLFLPWTNR